MIFTVYKKKRRGKNGKMISDRLYRGKYRLDGDYDVTDISLETSDKQVAEQKLREVVREKEMERAGILAPKLERESATKPLALHLKDFMADLKVKGRAEKYCKGVQSNILRLLKDLEWKLPIDITANDFIQWRAKQTEFRRLLNVS